jgi:hypothetical protein
MHITNILLSPDFQRLRAELVRVLARYPEAQAEVAAFSARRGCGQPQRWAPRQRK